MYVNLRQISIIPRLREILPSLKEGLQFIRQDQVVAVLLGTWYGVQMLFASGPMSIGLPVFAREILGSGAEGYGFIVVGIASSSLLLSIVLGQKSHTTGRARLIMIGFVWGAVGMFVFSLTTTVVSAIVMAFL